MLKSLIDQFKLACCSFRKSEFTVFKGSLKFQRSSHLLCRYRIISYELCSFLNLSRFIHCSVIKVPTSLLPELYKLLRNFYHLRDLLSFPRQLIYIIISFIVCQQLFLFIFQHLFDTLLLSKSATRLYYHKLFDLSTTFYFYFQHLIDTMLLCISNLLIISQVF